MLKLLVIPFTFLLSGICSAESIELSKWNPQWNFDPMNDSISCSVFSKQISFKGEFGINRMYLGVQGDGIVTFQSHKNAFDNRYLSEIGIRIDENDAIFYPEYRKTGLIQFSKEKSQKIIDQLISGQYFTVQAVFFPEEQRVNKKLHVGTDFESFKMAYTSKQWCENIKNGEGWVGVGFADIQPVDSYMSFIKENTDFDAPGVMIWSVHPKKLAHSSGLKNFDIVLGVNGSGINVQSFLKTLKSMKPKDEVILKILRGNDFKTIKLKRP